MLDSHGVAYATLAPMSPYPHTHQIRLAMAETNDLFNKEVFGRGNFEALDLVYTANARILPPGAPMITGREEIKKFWSNAIAAMKAKSIELETVEATPTGDSVIEIGRARITVEPQGQFSSSIEAKYVVQWMQEDDRWKWHVDIWNANA